MILNKRLKFTFLSIKIHRYYYNFCRKTSTTGHMPHTNIATMAELARNQRITATFTRSPIHFFGGLSTLRLRIYDRHPRTSRSHGMFSNSLGCLRMLPLLSYKSPVLTQSRRKTVSITLSIAFAVRETLTVFMNTY